MGYLSLPAVPERAAGGPPSMEVSLESAPAPEPAKEEPAEAQTPPPQPEPVQPVEIPPPPPPPPQEVQEEKPADEAPKPPEMLVDDEGETTKLSKLDTVAPELNSKFADCVLKKATYPSTKEARKLKPRGLVELKAYVSDGKILAIEIVTSSGSSILDAAARSTVQNSGCGPIVGNGVVVGGLKY